MCYYFDSIIFTSLMNATESFSFPESSLERKQKQPRLMNLHHFTVPKFRLEISKIFILFVTF